jgi:hypothetical protein
MKHSAATDQRLVFPECDGSTFATITGIPISYSLAEVWKIRYGVITRLRGYSIYGLRLDAGGKTQGILPGLKPRYAEKLLMTLKAFGADVPDDPPVPSKLKEGAFA